MRTKKQVPSGTNLAHFIAYKMMMEKRHRKEARDARKAKKTSEQ